MRTAPHAPGTIRDTLLQEAAVRLGTGLIGEEQVTQGARPSVGAPTDRGTWARISWHRPETISLREFSGLEASAAIGGGVPRPAFIQAVHWMQAGFVCRAEEMTRIDYPVVSKSYAVGKRPVLTSTWWARLSSALTELAATETDRVSIRQSDIDNSIAEAFGPGVDTTISQWAVGHGDLHWANITAPGLVLLDWDTWGVMPRPLDAAKLWAASYRLPSLAQEVTERLARDFLPRDWTICKVWVCANRVLGARRLGEHTDQTDHALRSAQTLLHQLSRDLLSPQ